MASFLHIIPLLILAGYVFLLIKTELNHKVLRRSAEVILVLGTALYMMGYIQEGYQAWTLSFISRSLISAAKMFIYSTDLCEILVIQTKPLFLDAFMTVFSAAIITSISTILLIFSKRITTFVILNFRKGRFKHVFLGINKRSIMLAKSLPGKDTAFIEFPFDREGNEASALSFLKLLDAESGNLKSTGTAVKLRAKRDMSAGSGSGDILEYIGLGQMHRLIGKDTAFYIFGDDEEKNLQDVLTMAEDYKLRNNTIHVCLERDGLARAYKSLLSSTGVHFIYPSSLAAVELIDSPGFHPIDMMKLSTACPGTVEGGFHAQVIGFGETGQAVTKFLYEFSCGMCPDGSILPSRIHVSDRRMARLGNQFRFANPGIKHGESIIYHHCGIDSAELWDNLKDNLNKTNCVVLATEDEGSNLNMACIIYEYAFKLKGGHLDNFKILVRKFNTPDYEQSLVNRLNSKAGCEVVKCFGEYSKIFTAEKIVSSDSTGINATAISLGEEMQKRLQHYVAKSGVTGPDYGQTFHQKMSDRREAHQLISRANHLHTKRMLLGSAVLEGETLENIARCEHQRYLRYLTSHGYSYAPEDDDVLKTNHQICLWEDLTEEEREFHRNVARASLLPVEN